MDTAGENEEAPLLSPPPHTDLSPEPPATATPSRLDWLRVAWLIVLCILIQIAASTVNAPYVRLLESVVCKNYYQEKDPSVIEQNGDIAEHFCKVPPVHQKMSLIQAIQKLLSFITGILASLYIPLVLESRGRKAVLALNLFFQFCTLLIQCLILRSTFLAPEWTWMSSLFVFGAGGPDWRGEIIFMLLADATHREKDVQDNAQNTYFAIGSQQAINGIIAYVVIKNIADLMAHFDRYIPLTIGLGMMVIIILFVLIVPINATFESHTPPNVTSWSHTASTQFGGVFKVVKLAPRSVCLLLSTYLASSTFPQLVDNSLFEQYISIRFQETISEASKFQADSMGMNVVVLLISMVALKTIFGSHYDRGWPVRYIYIGLGTAIAQCLGFTIIGMSWTYRGVRIGLALCALGQPLRIAIRCALLSMTYCPGQNTITGLFSAITLLDMTSGTFVNLLLTWLFTKSIEYKGSWFGLPFFFAAILLGAVATLVALAILFRPAATSTADS